VKITVTGDLDEFAIAELLANDAPVDSFGVVRKLVTATCRRIRLQIGRHRRRHDDATVAKRSIGKLSSGGAKDAYRLFVDDVR